MIYNMKKVTKWILALVLLPAFLVACEQKDNKAVKKEPKCDDDLVGLNVAVFSGTCYDIDLTQRGKTVIYSVYKAEGGGGHVRAAGCTITGKLPAEFMPEVRRLVEEQISQ